jgi:subtilisin family serine protease
MGHGTAMALLIAGRGCDRPAGTVGVAPAAKLLPARLNAGADAGVAIRWLVDHGATIINISLGGSAGHTSAYDEGLRYARQHDVVVIASAGNAATDKGVVSPADRPGVVAVSAVDRTGQFSAEVSVAGPQVMLAAPGVDLPTRIQGAVHLTSGTSHAAAIVSGIAALIRARFPDLSATAVVDLLTTTAKDAGPPGRDPQYGYGVVDPVAALTATVPEADHTLWIVLLGVAGTAVAVLTGLGMTGAASPRRRGVPPWRPRWRRRPCRVGPPL